MPAEKLVFFVWTQCERARRHDTTLTGDPSSNEIRTTLQFIEAVDRSRPREGPIKEEEVHGEAKGAWASRGDGRGTFSSADLFGSSLQDVLSRGTGGRGPRACTADALQVSPWIP